MFNVWSRLLAALTVQNGLRSLAPLLFAVWPLLLGGATGVFWLGTSLQQLQPAIEALERQPDGHWRTASLPVHLEGERLGQRYELHFSSGLLTPKVWNIVPDDDLQALTINGKQLPLDSLPAEQLHDWVHGVTVDLSEQIQTGENKFEVVLSNHSGPGGLSMTPVLSDWHHGVLLLSALPLLLGLMVSARRLSPWIQARDLWLLTLIIAGCGVRIWLVWRYNPVDHIWSDPQRHWEQGIDVLRMDPMSMIDPIMYQLYIATLGKLTLKLPGLVAFYTAALSILGPWLWYRFLRELLPSRTLALTGWALLVWLPSWSAIYSYFMQETLMLPMLGGALWATWRCRRKADVSSFLIAVLVWIFAGLTRGICIPMAAVAMCWLWFAQPCKIVRALVSLLILGGILGPLSVRSYHATHIISPHGVGAMVQLYQRSGAREILIDFKRQGAGWSYGFTSPGILQQPFEPLSDWQSSRQGSVHFSIDLDAGSRSWDEAKASIPWNWPQVANLAKENLIYLFFSESWPDTNRERLIGEFNHWLRWLWAPLSLACLILSIRLRKQQPERLLPAIILVWFVVQGLFPLSVNEGRYRKPFEGLLIAQCLLLAASLVQRKAVQTGSDAPAPRNGNPL